MADDIKKHLDQYFQQFGQQIQQVQQELGGQIQQVRQELGGRIQQVQQELGGRIQQVQQELGGRIQQLREETTQQFREMGQRMDRVEAEVREAHILIEDLPGQFSLVAEGIDNLRGQMERNDKELSRRIDEVMTFTRQVYRDLDARKLDKTA